MAAQIVAADAGRPRCCFSVAFGPAWLHVVSTLPRSRDLSGGRFGVAEADGPAKNPARGCGLCARLTPYGSRVTFYALASGFVQDKPLELT